jgi:hypothetical protein
MSVPALRYSVFALVAGVVVAATLVLAPASLARSTSRVHTLTVTAASTETASATRAPRA